MRSGVERSADLEQSTVNCRTQAGASTGFLGVDVDELWPRGRSSRQVEFKFLVGECPRNSGKTESILLFVAWAGGCPSSPHGGPRASPKRLPLGTRWMMRDDGDTLFGLNIMFAGRAEAWMRLEGQRDSASGVLPVVTPAQIQFAEAPVTAAPQLSPTFSLPKIEFPCQRGNSRLGRSALRSAASPKQPPQCVPERLYGARCPAHRRVLGRSSHAAEEHTIECGQSIFILGAGQPSSTIILSRTVSSSRAVSVRDSFRRTVDSA